MAPRVLELTRTAHDMQPWADALLAAMRHLDPRARSSTPATPPVLPDPRRTAPHPRPTDVMNGDYPSETFRVLENNELREHGEYRAQRLVLAASGQMATRHTT